MILDKRSGVGGCWNSILNKRSGVDGCWNLILDKRSGVGGCWILVVDKRSGVGECWILVAERCWGIDESRGLPFRLPLLCIRSSTLSGCRCGMTVVVPVYGLFAF